MAEYQSELHLDTRADSPSPSISPTTAASSTCPGLDRSFSPTSSMTSYSSLSTPLDGSIIDPASKRRGYTRPQATVFADSARNRDSVMSLGTIAHLQYYFARTGLLDGKGAQLARERKDAEFESKPGSRTPSGSNQPPTQSFLNADALSQLEAGSTSDLLASPQPSHRSDPSDEPELLSLPPTFSTYKKKELYVPPPPNLSVLRRELREALEDAKKVLEAQEACNDKTSSSSGAAEGSTPTDEAPPTQGWHEIEGLHVLDLVTLAIKAAKNYYTSHDQPQRLYSIQPERRIRAELFNVLEVLKRVGSRNFAGGYRHKEIHEMLRWISNIEIFVSRDEKAEMVEQEQRESWLWLNGSCAGHEREREWVFLKSFEPKGEPLPVWTEPLDAPTPFLLALKSGIKLVQLHNELVQNSWRPWGEIKSWHTDTSKPYRCTENLRFWIKAAQLRWSVQLDVDVSGIANNKSLEAWKGLDAAVLKWTHAVRDQMTSEWKEYKDSTHAEPPMLQVKSGPAVFV